MSTPDSIRVQPGAANYFSHPGALDRIEQFHPAGTLQRVLWIGGKRAQAAAVSGTTFERAVFGHS